MKLKNAPPGLFMHNGVVGLKTEYWEVTTEGYCTPVCYVVESGEIFHGDAKTIAERNDLEVAPITLSELVLRSEDHG